jgi:hypothetical protein
VGLEPDDGRFTTGVAAGRLFALLVGGSNTVGVGPLETPDSLRAMALETRALMENALREPSLH